MKPDEPTPPAGQPTPDTPPASLTAVRIARRKAAPPASGKAGDLTQQLGTVAPADPQADAPPDPAVASMPPLAPAAPPARAAVAAPAPEPPRPAAPVAPAEPPHSAAPPSARSARLLGEDDIRQLLDPPERRAAAEPPAPPPAIAASERPTDSAPPPRAPAPATAAPVPPVGVEPPPPAVVEPTPTAIEPPPLMVEPDERDAVPAAPALRLVAETPAPAARAEAPAERSSSALPTTIDQIIDYWDSLRGGKPVPPLDALDRGLVRRSWPNCLLVAYGAAPKLTRIGEENGEIEYLEMVIHWILSRGQIAATRGEPMEEEKRFPVSDGNARYQLLLLPLANADGKSEHVLCHLLRVKEAAKPKGFRRWLAS